MASVALQLRVGGPHTVREALSSDVAKVREVLLAEGSDRGELEEQVAHAKVPLRRVSRKEIDRFVGGEHHQGVAADVTLTVWERFRDFFEAREGKGSLLSLAVDQVEDPQNLGGLIRSAHFFGAEAFLLTRDRTAPLSSTVAKASAGALFSLPIIWAKNLARELEECEDLGILRVGLAASAPSLLSETDLKDRHILLVVGGESEGLRRLTSEHCDILARISATGLRDSLNASVAGAVALYEACRQRQGRSS